MIFWLIIIFILGTTIGSFLNVVIDRATQGKSILGRSYCDHCRATLKTFDLIPIVSFVGLGAKCRYCRRPISWQYPLVEALTGILFVLAFYTLVALGQIGIVTLLLYLFIISILIVVAVVDWKFSLIPTSLVFLASLLTLFYDYFYLSSFDFVIHVFAAFGLALAFAAIVLVTGGRGMGTGDIPLAFLMGLILGWPQTVVAIFLAFGSGAIVSILLLLVSVKRFGQTIPFGPFLVLGTLVALFWGRQIISWYLALL